MTSNGYHLLLISHIFVIWRQWVNNETEILLYLHPPGRSCDQCQDGTYNLEASNEVGCEPCYCNTTYGAVNSSCHVTSGQCNCANHVTGERCDMCTVGYFGMNLTDIQRNGCSEVCDCDPRGTESTMTGVCEAVGGQCSCKPGILGRRCDQCSPGGYGFGTSATSTCQSCDCDVRGTVNASVACDNTGVCPCKSRVNGMKCTECTSGYYGLDGDVIEGCRSCDCTERGTVFGSNCSRDDGQCVCNPGSGDVQYGGRTCVSTEKQFQPVNDNISYSVKTGRNTLLTPSVYQHVIVFL